MSSLSQTHSHYYNKTTTGKTNFFLLDSIVYVLCAAGVVTLLTDILPLSSFLNRAILGLYLLVLILLVLSKINTKSFLFLFFMALLIGIDFATTGSNIRKLNDVFYYPLWCFNLLFFILYYQSLRSLFFVKHKTLRLFALLWTGLTLLSVFYPGAFVNFNGIRSFVGFTGSPHRFAGTALFAILCFVINYLKTRKISDILLIIVPLASIFYCGARTYLIIALIFILFLFLFFIKSKFLRNFFLLLGFVFIVLMGIYVTRLRMVGASYAWQLSNYGLLYFVTSGRSVFWVTDLVHFFDSSIWGILFGRGYNFVYDINEVFYNSAIWAHNDYINVLLTHGVAGLVLFLGVFAAFIKTVSKQNPGQLNRLFLLLFLSFIVFNASFNMVYTYTMANLTTPVFGIIMLDSNEYRIKTRRWKNKMVYV